MRGPRDHPRLPASVRPLRHKSLFKFGRNPDLAVSSALDKISKTAAPAELRFLSPNLYEVTD